MDIDLVSGQLNSWGTKQGDNLPANTAQSFNIESDTLEWGKHDYQ